MYRTVPYSTRLPCRAVPYHAVSYRNILPYCTVSYRTVPLRTVARYNMCVRCCWVPKFLTETCNFPHAGAFYYSRM